MPNKYSACNRQLVWDRNSYKNKAWGSICSCSDEEKTSQQEDEVGGEAGGGALLHQAGAVTPEKIKTEAGGPGTDWYLHVSTAGAATNLRTVDLRHFSQAATGSIDRRAGGFECEGLLGVLPAVILSVFLTKCYLYIEQSSEILFDRLVVGNSR